MQSLMGFYCLCLIVWWALRRVSKVSSQRSDSNLGQVLTLGKRRRSVVFKALVGPCDPSFHLHTITLTKCSTLHLVEDAPGVSSPLMTLWPWLTSIGSFSSVLPSLSLMEEVLNDKPPLPWLCWSLHPASEERQVPKPSPPHSYIHLDTEISVAKCDVKVAQILLSTSKILHI